MLTQLHTSPLVHFKITNAVLKNDNIVSCSTVHVLVDGLLMTLVLFMSLLTLLEEMKLPCLLHTLNQFSMWHEVYRYKILTMVHLI